MHPILTIARFELRYQLRQPLTYLFAALLVVQGVWQGMSVYDRYATDLLLLNAPAVVYLALASLGAGLALVACLLAGQALSKDLDHRTVGWLYAYPIADRDWFVGRFLGAFGAVLLLAVAYPLGVSLLPLFMSGQTGPVPISHLLDGYGWLMVQNLFIIVSLAYSLTVFLRGIRGAYVALFLSVLYFLLAEANTLLPLDHDLLKLLDPFGVGLVRDAIDSLTPDEKNSAFLQYPDLLYINRLLWMGLSLGLLVQAERTFSFGTFGEVESGVKARASNSRLPLAPVLLPHHPQPTPVLGGGFAIRFFVAPCFRRGLGVIRLWPAVQSISRLTQLEFQTLTRQPAFRIALGLLVLITILLATVLNVNPDFPELPITSRMTTLRGPIGGFITLFLLVFAVEQLYQERTLGFWAIFDALPQPDWQPLLAKLLALVGVAALLTLVLALTGTGLQLVDGQTPVMWRLYVLE